MGSLTQWIRKAELKLTEGKLKVDGIALCKYIEMMQTGE